jgi:Ca-activated chloride channel homolog
VHACSRLSRAKAARREGAHLGVEQVASRRRERIPSPVLIPCVLALLLWCVAVQSQSGSELSVKITSPLGRMGEPGTVRIVGQVRPAPGRSVAAVRFSVDGSLLGTVTNGPPYAVEWTDDNPFQRREIVVEAEDDEGGVGRDRIVLEPFVVTELAEITSVLVEAGVYDKAGRMVRGLTAPEFVLEEDGARQTPDMVAQETVPTTFALLVDSSQSMWRNMEFVRAAAGRLTAYLRPKDRVLVAPFSRQLRAITGPTQDRPTIDEAINAIDARGGTAMRDSMIQIAGRFDGVEGRRVIVLITDAYDEHSTSSLADALSAVKEAGATVYTIGIGGVAGISLKGHDELKSIAAGTGGRAFFPSRPTDLPNVYDVLANDAQLRYLVTYTPTNQKRDGSWRSISLRTYDESLIIKARTGYFAPKPPPVRPVLEFTAMDTRNQYLQIAKDDLVLFEDGVEQKIETFQEATSPVSMVLVLDSSGSMKQASEKVVASAAAFIGTLRPEDSLGMLTFADKVNVEHAITTNRTNTLETLAKYKAEGGTALYDALCDSLLMLKGLKGRRAVVILTDGRDEDNPGTGPGSIRTWDNVLRLLQDQDVTMFPVGLGTKIDPERLRLLATFTGGEAYFPQDVSELTSQFERVTENLRHRYIVGYTSTNPTRDGKWRSVEIRTGSAGVRITSRKGYFAPAR